MVRTLRRECIHRQGWMDSEEGRVFEIRPEWFISIFQVDGEGG